jgi:DNA-directed RNA polymerase subunit RPC12/RpoP
VKIKVINAGRCMLCGKEIKIVAKRSNNKFPNVFFCPRCEERRVKKEKENKE